MLYHYRIHFYKGVDVNKTSASKECIISLYCYFVQVFCTFCILYCYFVPAKKKKSMQRLKSKKNQR